MKLFLLLRGKKGEFSNCLVFQGSMKQVNRAIDFSHPTNTTTSALVSCIFSF
jgi:hypothetical protein